MKHRIVVAIELDIDSELVNCPVNGVSAIATHFANMALRYGSIGATAAEVLAIEEIASTINNQ